LIIWWTAGYGVEASAVLWIDVVFGDPRENWQGSTMRAHEEL
jgi:hypothetical protein